jgi:hypothetical protein
MKRLLILIALLAGPGAFAVQAQNKNRMPECDKDTQIGDVCIISVEKLHPTQFAVGMYQVLCKKNRLEGKEQDGKLEKYLRKKPAPIVRGLNNAFYLTDHHHLAVALANARLKTPNREMYARLQDDFSDSKNATEFWTKMEKHGYAWLHDNTGKHRKGDELPSQVQVMSDDPVRTLSAWVGEKCGYVKDGDCDCIQRYKKVTPGQPLFLEFKWADYLRTLDGVNTTGACRQADLNTGTCLSEQHQKLVGVFPTAMQAVVSLEADKALVEGSGYNGKADVKIAPPEECKGVENNETEHNEDQ